MHKRYSDLFVVSVLLKCISLIVIIAGIVVPFMWSVIRGGAEPISIALAIAIIVGGLAVSIIIYAFADLIVCIMDIELNTRATESVTKATEPDTKTTEFGKAKDSVVGK